MLQLNHLKLVVAQIQLWRDVQCVHMCVSVSVSVSVCVEYRSYRYRTENLMGKINSQKLQKYKKYILFVSIASSAY